LVPEKLAVSVAPNPFNPVASISVAVPEEGFLSVNIVDMSGRVVSNLYSGPASAGIQELKWNASDAPAGIYFVHVKLSGSSIIKRIVLVK
ncbi:MAG TPA: T9SS type A sorting domain-containing protein, partial [candidate division Zixibacteria bacterium]|nr:T9SS type A sorting domain-containing protein [candidate division Zixibacteria bacterium]